MDNAPFHKSTEVKTLLTTNRIVYKYLVPYSPELNPIEECFSMIKSRFTKIRNDDNVSIEYSMRMIMQRNVQDSVDMRDWLDKARRREPFIKCK